MALVLEFKNVMVAVIDDNVDVRFETTSHADALKLAEALVGQLRELGVEMHRQEMPKKKDMN